MSRRFLTPVSVPSHSDFPVHGTAGDIFFHSVQLTPYIHDGTNWGPMGGGGGSGVPAGGTEGQIIVKQSDITGDVAWEDNSPGEIRISVKNSSNSETIFKGTAVMATGATGDTIVVSPSVADGSVSGDRMLGVAWEDIAPEATGYIVLVGEIQGLDTSLYDLGTILYLDPLNPGGYTVTEPDSPALEMSVGFVTRKDQSAGRIFVRMWRQFTYLHELGDVEVHNPNDKDTLLYNATSGLWESAPQPTVGNLDGGQADSNYGGIVAIYGGEASTF